MNFGKNKQVQIKKLEDYYFILGFLAKNENKTKIVWEHNEEQGAWGSEGRIQFFTEILPNVIRNSFELTKGVGNIKFRLNCNEFVEHIVNNHNFVFGKEQDYETIKQTIPKEFLKDFEKGYKC